MHKISPGDIAFFKRAQGSTQKDAPQVAFAGHAFGVLLGVVPNGVRDPDINDVTAMMAGIGYIAFDEVQDLLGEETCDNLLKLFADKYKVNLREAPAEVISSLLSATGEAIVKQNIALAKAEMNDDSTN